MKQDGNLKELLVEVDRQDTHPCHIQSLLSAALLAASPASLDPPMVPCRADVMIPFTDQKAGLRSAKFFAGSGQVGVGNQLHLTTASGPFAVFCLS